MTGKATFGERSPNRVAARITVRRTLTILGLVCASLALPGTAAGSPPVNDNFADARPLDGIRGLAETRNLGATKEPREPNHAGNPGGRSVWFRWTAPDDVHVAFTTFGSDFDTLLAVYVGTSVDGLAEIAASDDAGDGVEAGILSFPATKGTVYYVAVDGFAGKAGRVALAWMPAPRNDHFENAEPIGERAGTIAGTTVGATWEPGEPIHHAGGAGMTVWYRWTATADGLVSFDTRGSRGDTILAAYSGADVTELTRVATNDDDPFLGCCSSRLSFRAAAGETYYLAVDAFVGARGRITLSWRPLLIGTPRTDVLVGTQETEEIRGLAGGDVIRPGGGNDIVFAGAGADVIGGSAGDDSLFGGAGDDRIADRLGADRLQGDGDDDRLDAKDAAGRDVVAGGAGTDVCRADGADIRTTCP